MATPAFPSWITFTPLQQGYGEEMATNQVASKPQSGAPILRSRSILSQDLVTFVIPISSAEWEAVIYFHRHTCGDGTLQFTMPHPRTKAGATWAWQPGNPPKVSQTYGETFEIVLALRFIAFN